MCFFLCRDFLNSGGFWVQTPKTWKIPNKASLKNTIFNEHPICKNLYFTYVFLNNTCQSLCREFLKYSGSALKSVRIRWKKSASCLKIKSHFYFTFKKVILTINNNCNLWTRIFRERLNFRKHVLVFNNKRLIFNLYTFFCHSNVFSILVLAYANEHFF